MSSELTMQAGPEPRGDGRHPEPREPAAAPDTSGGKEGRSLERWIGLATSVLAPTTVVTALLFYFGYVATAAEFGYFGITLGTVGFSTQELALRSIAALYVPLGGLFLGVLAVTWTHQRVRQRLGDRRGRPMLRRLAVGLLVAGALAAGRGVVGVLVPEVARREGVAVTPLGLAVGVTFLAYGRYLLQQTAPSAGAPGPGAARGYAIAAAIVVLALFWATSSFAGAYGHGVARVAAARLADRPGVVLDTRERLYMRYPGVEESMLPPAKGQTFHYRYRGLRLLVEADGRMFLLPEQWRRGTGATLVVPVDDSVRVQFY